MAINRKLRAILILFAVLVLLGSALHFIDLYVLHLPLRVNAVCTLLLVASCIIAGVFLSDNVPRRTIRRHLIAGLYALAVWFLIDLGAESLVRPGSLADRVFFYLQHIPLLVIPNATLFAALHIGLDSSAGISRKWHLTSAVTVLMSLALLTNDLHGWAFSIPAGEAAKGAENGVLYYIAVGWVLLTVTACSAVLYEKCMSLGRRRQRWIPMMGLALTLLYALWYMGRPLLADSWAGAFPVPESVAIIYFLVILGLLRAGMIVTNVNNIELFSASTLSANIVSDSGQIRFHTAGAVAEDAGYLRDIPPGQSMALDGNTRLNRQALHGGSILWREDLTALNRVRRELAEKRFSLEEEGDLLQAENEVRARYAKAEEQNRLYEMLTSGVARQLETIDTLLRQAESGDEQTLRRALAEACVYKAYVKRHCNLMLLSHNRESLSAFELTSSLQESLDALQLCGVSCRCVSRLGEQPLPAGDVLLIYELFQAAVETALGRMTALLLHLDFDRGAVTVRMNLDGLNRMPELWASRAKSHDAEVSFRTEDGAAYLTLLLRGGERP